MPQAKTPTCGWRGCDSEATTDVHLDAGSTTCEKCGSEVTERRTYWLCAEHNEQYAASGDVTLLLLSAKEA